MSIKEIIRREIKISLEKNNLSTTEPIIVKKTPKQSYCTNIAIPLSREKKETPSKLARKLKETISQELFSKIEVDSFGYLTLTIKPKVKQNFINLIIKEKRNYGKQSFGNQTLIAIEYLELETNNKDYSIIHADNIAKIFKNLNYDITSEYYTNQLFFDEAKRKQQLEKLRININTYNTRKQIEKKNNIEEIIVKFKQTGLCYFTLTGLSIKETEEKSTSLIEENGEYSDYLLILANTINLIKKGYRRIIYISNLTNDSLKSSLEFGLKLLGLNPKTIHWQSCHYSSRNEPSTINEIRYNFVREYQSPTTTKSPQSIKTYQEIEQINKRLETLINNYNKKLEQIKQYNTIPRDKTYSIMNKLIDFEEIVEISARTVSPKLIIQYIEELTIILLKNYKEELSYEAELLNIEEVNCLIATKIIIDNSLNLIGIIT